MKQNTKQNLKMQASKTQLKKFKECFKDEVKIITKLKLKKVVEALYKKKS